MKNQAGFVLALTIIVIVILTFVVMLVLSLGVHQKTLADAVSGTRMVAYYRSQAGIVDAQWRIRENVIHLDKNGDLNSDLVDNGKDFSFPEWDPPAYYIDLDDDTTSLTRRSVAGGNIDDVQVDIGPIENGTRAIDSVGYDSNR